MLVEHWRDVVRDAAEQPGVVQMRMQALDGLRQNLVAACLINFQRSESVFDWLIDSARQDVGPARKAFDDFALLLQKYPNSRFAGDSRARMVYLRNRIAEHELSIVKYYVRRGAPIPQKTPLAA